MFVKTDQHDRDGGKTGDDGDQLAARDQTLLGRVRRWWRETVRPLLIVLLVLFTFRSAVADWNDVPTGSMKPSIMEGDRIFVNKLAYDLRLPFTQVQLMQWSTPQRGDVVVFYEPSSDVRMVKRVIGVPGDIVELRDNRLVINGEFATYDELDSDIVEQVSSSERPFHVFASEGLGGMVHPVMTTPSLPASRRSFAPIRIPDGKYLMMGDNRDNSRDSRWFGLVDMERIVGRASGVVVSLDREHHYRPRWDRFFRPLP